ncbi:MAG TPA: hypothetical protein ENI99_06115 [Sedimenticola sp.]|nr:hypothetical protein [Sedimenticola sp.]
MKTLFVSLSVFLLLCGATFLASYMYLSEQSPEEMFSNLYTDGKLLLYKHGMLVKKLSPDEVKRLYTSTCTRKCHGKDVIEDKPRTAPEWAWIMARMKAPDRAGITDRHAETITRYLQEHFLSNVPTFLPENTMRFIKRHLWKSDFGESDLYLDFIYLPKVHLSLLPYLVATSSPPQISGTAFVVFINTHQGKIPPWDLAKMATIQDGDEAPAKALAWEIIYEDGQNHHKQGILTFPPVDESKATSLTITIKLPGLRKRTYMWNRPIPIFEKKDHAKP